MHTTGILFTKLLFSYTHMHVHMCMHTQSFLVSSRKVYLSHLVEQFALCAFWLILGERKGGRERRRGKRGRRRRRRGKNIFK